MNTHAMLQDQTYPIKIAILSNLDFCYKKITIKITKKQLFGFDINILISFFQNRFQLILICKWWNHWNLLDIMVRWFRSCLVYWIVPVLVYIVCCPANRVNNHKINNHIRVNHHRSLVSSISHCCLLIDI